MRIGYCAGMLLCTMVSIEINLSSWNPIVTLFPQSHNAAKERKQKKNKLVQSSLIRLIIRRNNPIPNHNRPLPRTSLRIPIPINLLHGKRSMSTK